MKNKNLIIIFCHCNSKAKLKVLEKNIKILKSNNFDILITSHTPVPERIQSQVDYLIYDKSNPILRFPYKTMNHWKEVFFGDKKYHLVNSIPDYGWCFFNQILLTGHLGLSLDYSHFTIINYDTLLTPSCIESMHNPKDFILSTVKMDKGGNIFPSCIFILINRKNLQKLLPLLNKHQYTFGNNNPQKQYFPSAEDYFNHLISIFDYEIHPELLEEEIRIEKEINFNFNSDNDIFKLFFQSVTNPDHYLDEPTIYLYDIKKEIKFLINGSEFIANEPQYLMKYKRINSFGYWLNDEYIDITNIFNTERQTFINIQD